MAACCAVGPHDRFLALRSHGAAHLGAIDDVQRNLRIFVPLRAMGSSSRLCYRIAAGRRMSVDLSVSFDEIYGTTLP